jgi:hypothetical protein
MELLLGDYEEILSTLVDSAVDFIIAGGVVCLLHGVERVALDVDIAVALDGILRQKNRS